MLVVLLILLLVIAVGITALRKRTAVRWLFTLLSIIFWIAFLALFGFVVGYTFGGHIHLRHLLG